MQSSTTPIKPCDRTLRWITILAWIPGFAFLLTHGIVSHGALPAIGIMPLTFSVAFGGFHLSGMASKTRPRNVNLLIDFALALLYIGLLIPSWILMAHGNCWRWCGGQTRNAILATYGTCPMIANFVIHAYFVLREPFTEGFSFFTFGERKCPHCAGDLRAKNRPVSSSKESYQRVNMADAEDYDGCEEAGAQAGPAAYNDHDVNQPRPSTDDETARLV